VNDVSTQLSQLRSSQQNRLLRVASSDPVPLSNDTANSCLSGDLSLVNCTDDDSTAEWVHAFDDSVTGEVDMDN